MKKSCYYTNDWMTWVNWSFWVVAGFFYIASLVDVFIGLGKSAGDAAVAGCGGLYYSVLGYAIGSSVLLGVLVVSGVTLLFWARSKAEEVKLEKEVADKLKATA